MYNNITNNSYVAVLISLRWRYIHFDFQRWSKTSPQAKRHKSSLPSTIISVESWSRRQTPRLKLVTNSAWVANKRTVSWQMSGAVCLWRCVKAVTKRSHWKVFIFCDFGMSLPLVAVDASPIAPTRGQQTEAYCRQPEWYRRCLVSRYGASCRIREKSFVEPT